MTIALAAADCSGKQSSARGRNTSTGSDRGSRKGTPSLSLSPSLSRSPSPVRNVDIDKIKAAGDEVELDLGDLVDYPEPADQDLPAQAGWNEWDTYQKAYPFLKQIADNYETMLNNIEEIVTKGGASFKKIRFTYEHDKRIYSNTQTSRASSYRSQKEDIYLVAFLNERTPKWEVIPNKAGIVKVKLKQDLKRATIQGGYTYPHEPALKDRVCRSVLLRALEMLFSGKNQQEAFQSICYHIAEAVRFKHVKGQAILGMLTPIIQSIEDERKDLNNWRRYSEYLIFFKYPPVKQLSQDQAQGMNSVGCGKMNPRMRDIRRCASPFSHTQPNSFLVLA
ncbi:hypothetical protein OROMI_015668 [Orobanche minor]